jgi:hypothetical protein
MTVKDKIGEIIRHIKRVEDNCNIVSMKMADIDPHFALEITRRGRSHDASKLSLIEFHHLWKEEKNFDVALVHHHTHNSHHPEHYPNGIYGMSDADLCEMVCDCTARAQEFGTDVRIWFFDKAPKKYGYENDQEIYQKLEYYLNILLNKPF